MLLQKVLNYIQKTFYYWENTVGFHKNILTQIFENCVLFNLQKIMCILKYQQWKFIINLLYLSKSYSEVKWDFNIFISLLFEIFLNFIFLMCPQIVSNWNLNSFLVGKVWRSERRRWGGLSPHWSHKSRQQGTFGGSCQFMH